MKTHVNQHNFHLSTIALLVSASLILLAFGIYQVFNMSNQQSSFGYANETVENANQRYSSEVSKILYTHVNTDNTTRELIESQQMVNDFLGISRPSVVSELAGVFAEEPLELESWMTDVSGWINTGVDLSGAMFSEEEAELTIQPWMLSDEGWYDSKAANEPMAGDEEALRLESWMLDDASWLTETAVARGNS